MLHCFFQVLWLTNTNIVFALTQLTEGCKPEPIMENIIKCYYVKSLWLKMPFLKEKLQKTVHWNNTGAPFCLWQLVYSPQHPTPSAATEPRRPKTNSGWKGKLIEYQREKDPAGVCRHEGVFISHQHNYWTKRACLQFYTCFASLWEKHPNYYYDCTGGYRSLAPESSAAEKTGDVKRKTAESCQVFPPAQTLLSASICS